MKNPGSYLKLAFLTGAVIDGLAAVAMLVPDLARPVWGLSGLGADYRFAMGYGAALMLGWTALLVWAALRPLERRFVAILTTAPVLVGLAATELWAVAIGLVALPKLLPLLVMQHLAMLIFVGLYWAARNFTRPAEG
jgi:hypothetical protein